MTKQTIAWVGSNFLGEAPFVSAHAILASVVEAVVRHGDRPVVVVPRSG